MNCGELFDGKYRILKMLGQGGMGRVYLAQNVKLGTLWAVKEIGKKTDSKINMLVEPNILKKLNHPALPRIFDIIEDESSLYVIVDYIEGTSLDKKLKDAGKFPEEIVLEWASQMCEVLDYLHSFKPNPIIYRDMKPANIILTNSGHIKLIDFGIAREYKSESENDTVYIGTKGYAAPEQYGIGQSNVTTDIYSFGVTLHHLLTGKSPVELPCEIKPVRFYNKDLSENVDNIITKCTKQEPSERYQSVKEIQVDINKICARYKVNNQNEIIFPYANKENTFTKPAVFKKIILTIWDNAEFGCEFAYAAAKLTDFNVLLVDLDLLAPKADLYLNIKKYPERIVSEGIFNNSGLDIIMDSISKNIVTADILLEASIRRRDLKNLFVLTGNYNLDNYEYYDNDSLVKLIEKAYENFDITILLVNRSIYDSFTVISLIKSDYNIIPLRADITEFREFNKYLVFLKDKQHIPVEKSKFAAFEYDEQVNLNQSQMREITDNNYIGSIRYSKKRVRYRNIRSAFLPHMDRNIWQDYVCLLARFNILEKPTILSELKKKFLKIRNKPPVIPSN